MISLFINFEVLNKTLWDGRITFDFKIDSLLIYNGIFNYEKNSQNFKNNFFGYYFDPSFSIKVKPLENLYITAGYGGFFNFYNKYYPIDNTYSIKPFYYQNNPFLSICYNNLEINRGINTKVSIDFFISDKDYYWGYDNNQEKIDFFSFLITNENLFRIPIEKLNNTYFQFDVSGYFSYNTESKFGTQKTLDYENTDDLVLSMNGYNEREIYFYKALKMGFISYINYFNKKYFEDKFTTILNFVVLFAYDVMFFNDNKDYQDFVLDDMIINGFSISKRFIIKNIFPKVTTSLIFDVKFSYGFDIYNYQNNFDRFILSTNIYYSISI